MILLSHDQRILRCLRVMLFSSCYGSGVVVVKDGLPLSDRHPLTSKRDT